MASSYSGELLNDLDSNGAVYLCVIDEEDEEGEGEGDDDEDDA